MANIKKTFKGTPDKKYKEEKNYKKSCSLIF